MTVYRMHFRLNNIWMKNSIIVKVLIFGTSIIVILVLIIGFERANNYFQHKPFSWHRLDTQPMRKSYPVGKKGNRFGGKFNPKVGPEELNMWRSDQRPQKRDALQKQQDIIDKVKTEMMKTCSPEDVEDTEFIKEILSNQTILLPGKHRLQQLSWDELEMLFHRYLEIIQYSCTKRLRLGNVGDGGWDICDEAKFKPTPPCLVYSFGIGNDFSFDDAVIRKYGCEVHSFDPTMANDSYRRGVLNYFHAIGIAGRNQMTKSGRPLLTYSSVREKLGHTERKISIVKLDVERWESEVLPDMLKSGGLFNVDSLSVEFHLNLMNPAKEEYTYLHLLCTLKDLYDKGFRVFWVHRNPACNFVSRCRKKVRTFCHEVDFVRVE